MSLKGLLMPLVSRRLLSRQALLARRARAERRRVARGERHRVLVFHQVDDPYSALLAASLPRLAARYDVDLVPHLVGPPADEAAPERERLVAYSRRDAERLARHHGLEFCDPGTQPAPEAVGEAQALLLAAIEGGRFVEVAGEVSAALWQPASSNAAPTPGRSTAMRAAGPAAVRAHVAAAQGLRHRLGHYLGATLFYGGEWTWGIDRLYHLERRLQELGAQRPGAQGLMFPPGEDLREPVALDDPPAIDFFFSLRSPYSAIVAPRVFELGRLTGAPIRLRYLLPMVMRGLPVPRIKRQYIAEDAAREAFERGIPFGCIADPVGRPAERGLALVPLAERVGRGPDFVLSFMRGVWAEGIDAGTDRGLRRIADRAGLAWADCLGALEDDRWRATAERNRQEMFDLGLWGVPSFRVADTVVWGQDRLWAVQEALLPSRRGPKP